MKKSNILFDGFGYELLDENQQDNALREKLIELYSTPLSDILWWEVRDSSIANNKYYRLYCYEQGILKHIILFKYFAESQEKIFILNQEFTISVENIEQICSVLFDEFDAVKQIIFEHIFVIEPKNKSKMISYKSSNDVIIQNLPESIDAYMMSLGHRTRKHIKLCSSRIAENYPDYKVQFYENSNISLEQIKKVIEMNAARMRSTGIVPLIDETECNAIHKYVSTSGNGLLCICNVNNEIVGATITSIIGEHAYVHTMSHNELYNKYSLGQISLFNVTKYLIEEKNISHCHLLYGDQEYKFRHGGINHDLYTVQIFRNKNLSLYYEKTIRAIKVNYRIYWKKLRTRLKKNKIIYDFVKKIRKILKIRTNHDNQ